MPVRPVTKEQAEKISLFFPCLSWGATKLSFSLSPHHRCCPHHAVPMPASSPPRPHPRLLLCRHATPTSSPPCSRPCLHLCRQHLTPPCSILVAAAPPSRSSRTRVAYITPPHACRRPPHARAPLRHHGLVHHRVATLPPLALTVFERQASSAIALLRGTNPSPKVSFVVPVWCPCDRQLIPSHVSGLF